MTRTPERGFTLIELMITLIVLGITLAFSVPNFSSYLASQNLFGSASNIAAQMRLSREKAIATGQQQHFHIAENYPTTADYHMHNNGVVGVQWSLPKNVTYYWGSGTTDWYVFSPDGTCDVSGMVIVQDHRGRRDTVVLQLSGLITHR
jgi:prepilin-type N-terminal cleavage/methylation domain-containing protein